MYESITKIIYCIPVELSESFWVHLAAWQSQKLALCWRQRLPLKNSLTWNPHNKNKAFTRVSISLWFVLLVHWSPNEHGHAIIRHTSTALKTIYVYNAAITALILCAWGNTIFVSLPSGTPQCTCMSAYWQIPPKRWTSMI